MAKRRTKRAKARAEKKLRHERSMLNPGGESKYARKKAWLSANDKWGWEVPEPKPWR